MPTKYDNRRARLRLLVEKHSDDRGRGGITEVASLSGLSRATVHQAIHDLLVGVAKGARSRAHTHQLGDDAARSIEIGLGLTVGSMDDPMPSTLCFEEHKVHGLALKNWMGRAIGAGVLSDVEAQVELVRLRDLYPGVGEEGDAEEAVPGRGQAVGKHELIFGTSGSGRTALWARSTH